MVNTVLCTIFAESFGYFADQIAAGKSAVLYIGGIAELFLASHSEEKLFAAKRKGFVKLARRTGAEIVPVYMFGNSSGKLC